MTKLHRLAIARSGDKGDRATLSVVAIDRADYPLLARQLGADRVQRCFGGLVRGPVQRHELPALGALHFVLHGALAGGVTRSLALDAHGKTLASALLDLDIDTDPPRDAGASPSPPTSDPAAESGRQPGDPR